MPEDVPLGALSEASGRELQAEEFESRRLVRPDFRRRRVRSAPLIRWPRRSGARLNMERHRHC